MSRNDEAPAVLDDAMEAGALASELARAYKRMALFYRDQYGLTGPEADARARGADHTPEEAAAHLARVRDSPPDQVSWFQLQHILERDPEAMRAIWQAVKAAARDELHSGHRAAQAHEWQGSPWDRAQFLAIRDGFRADYRPRPGLEAAMVDMAAEAFSTWLQLSERYQRIAGADAELEETTLDRNGKWRKPHYTSVEHEDRIEAAAERAHARFLRTVKALTDLRRAGPVFVGQAGQVNMGQQQVNVARPATEGGGDKEQA